MALDDALFDFAYKHAFGDSLWCYSELSGITRLIKHNDEIPKIVRRYLDAVMDKTASFEDFKTAVQNIEAAAKRSHLSELTFVHIQKLINITAAYLYIGCYRNPDAVARFSACHCPMDHKMIRVVLNELKTVDATPLSEHNKKQLDFFLLNDTKTFLTTPCDKDTAFLQYELFQKIVSFLAALEHISPMAYYWVHA